MRQNASVTAGLMCPPLICPSGALETTGTGESGDHMNATALTPMKSMSAVPADSDA